MSTHRILTSAQAINEALAVMGERDNKVLLMGQGIDDKGAFYGTTAGLREIYKDRLIETPVSENAMVGVAVGLAMSGYRPVIQFHRVEFALLAMEQIANNCSKMSYISNGKHSCPLVIRLIIGRGWGNGPEHTQSLETMFACIPGLKVLVPTFPCDYKNMIIAAIEDNNPVIILENRWTHYVKGIVAEGYYKQHIEKILQHRTGNKCTIVANGTNLLHVINTIDADIFDMRVLRPLNCEEIIESVRKTRNLIIYDTGHVTYGIGAEIISQCVEAGVIFSVKRYGLPQHPIPSSRGYLPAIYPDGGGDQPIPEFTGPF